MEETKKKKCQAFQKLSAEKMKGKFVTSIQAEANIYLCLSTKTEKTCYTSWLPKTKNWIPARSYTHQLNPRPQNRMAVPAKGQQRPPNRPNVGTFLLIIIKKGAHKLPRQLLVNYLTAGTIFTNGDKM
jgi:hypothetical protein